MRFESLDFFSIKPEFQVNSKNSFKTKIGAVLTLMLLMIVAAVSYYVLRELWRKTNPTVNTVKLSNPDPDFYSFGKAKQDIAFSFGTSNSTDPNFTKYIDVNAMSIVYNSTDYEFYDFSLIKCTVGGDPSNENSTYCLPKLDNIGIQGTYGSSSSYQSIIVQIIPAQAVKAVNLKKELMKYSKAYMLMFILMTTWWIHRAMIILLLKY